MTRTRVATALAAILLTFAVSPADDKPSDKPNVKLMGRWALPGKTKQRWEFHADGSITGTTDGKPVYFSSGSPGSPGPHLSYAIGAVDEEGSVEVTFTLRSDKSPGEGVYKAKLEFTRQGRWAVKYVQKPVEADRFPPPFPEGKKLYRPEDVTD